MYLAQAEMHVKVEAVAEEWPLVAASVDCY